jgi:hypothetical protein
MADATAIRIDKSAYITIDASGKELYPGFHSTKLD